MSVRVHWAWRGALAAISGDTEWHTPLPLECASFSKHAVVHALHPTLRTASRLSGVQVDQVDVVLRAGRPGAQGRYVHAFAPLRAGDSEVCAEVWHQRDPAYAAVATPRWTPHRSADQALSFAMPAGDAAQVMAWCRNHALVLPGEESVRVLLLALPALLSAPWSRDPSSTEPRAMSVYYRRPEGVKPGTDGVRDVCACITHCLRHPCPLELACFCEPHTTPGSGFLPWPSAADRAYAELLDAARWDALESGGSEQPAQASSEYAELLDQLQLNYARMLGDTFGDACPPGRHMTHGTEGGLHMETVPSRVQAYCNVCGGKIAEERLKCLNCPDYDACSRCESRLDVWHPGHKFVRVSTPDAVPASPFPEQWAKHPRVACNECGSALFGPRFKCSVCPDYDVCAQCESDPRTSHQRDAGAHHLFLKLDRPLDHTSWHTSVLSSLGFPWDPSGAPETSETGPGAAAAAVADAVATADAAAAARATGASHASARDAAADPPEPELPGDPPLESIFIPASGGGGDRGGFAGTLRGLGDAAALAQNMLRHPVVDRAVPALQGALSLAAQISQPRQEPRESRSANVPLPAAIAQVVAAAIPRAVNGLPQVDGAALGAAIQQVVAASLALSRGETAPEPANGATTSSNDMAAGSSSELTIPHAPETDQSSGATSVDEQESAAGEPSASSRASLEEQPSEPSESLPASDSREFDHEYEFVSQSVPADPTLD